MAEDPSIEEEVTLQVLVAEVVVSARETRHALQLKSTNTQVCVDKSAKLTFGHARAQPMRSRRHRV